MDDGISRVAAPPAQVTGIDLKVGFSGSNRGRLCIRVDTRDSVGDLTTQELFRSLEEGRAWTGEVVFTGEETSFRRDLPELVSRARDLGYRVIQLQTNGRVLSRRKTVEHLVQAGMTAFGPALHGPTPAVHDSLSRSPGSFRQIVRGIRNVKELGREVQLNSVITRENARHLPEMARLFVGLGVDQFRLAFPHALGSESSNFEAVPPRLSEVQGPVQAALRIGRAGGVEVVTEGIPLCFLGELREFASEWNNPASRPGHVDPVVEDEAQPRFTGGRIQGEACTFCCLQDVCEGPWQEYPEHFGWGEFEPVLGLDTELETGGTLSPEQVEHFRREGYVSGIPVLDRSEVVRFRGLLERVESQQRALHGGSWPERDHLPRRVDDHPLKNLFHTLARNSRVLDAVESILGPDNLVRNGDVFIKEPMTDPGIGWHQDTTMRLPEADHLLSVWIGLTPSTPENGGMRFSRGTHLDDLPTPHRPRDNTELTLTAEASRLMDPSRTVDNVLGAGEMSMHHSLTLHSSGPNGFDDRRIAFVIRYMSTAISPEGAECGVAMLVRGKDTVGRFHLKEDFPVTWTPMVP